VDELPHVVVRLHDPLHIGVAKQGGDDLPLVDRQVYQTPHRDLG